MSQTNRVFVCPLLPEKVIKKYKGSFAANNFCRNLISGGGFAFIYPIIPTGNICKDDLNYEYENLTYFLSKLRKTRWMKFAFILENYKIFKDIKQDSSVWFYNLNYTSFLLYVLLMVFKPSVKRNVIMLDYTPGQNGLAGMINKIAVFLMNKADGMIKLAYSDIFKCKNSIVLPGVIPAFAGQETLVSTPNNRFLLSGVLNEKIAQTLLVLNVFSKLPQCELHITGKADNESVIQEYAERFDNIIWHGMVPYEEYLKLLHNCTFVLSTRDPNSPENQCNFPSKIIESLFHNRIVVSTIQYKQLEGISYLSVPSEKNRFVESINNIISQDKTSLLVYANQGGKVVEMFSTSVWNETMNVIEEHE